MPLSAAAIQPWRRLQNRCLAPVGLGVPRDVDAAPVDAAACTTFVPVPPENQRHSPRAASPGVRKTHKLDAKLVPLLYQFLLTISDNQRHLTIVARRANLLK